MKTKRKAAILSGETSERHGCRFLPGATICGAFRPATLTRGMTAMRRHVEMMRRKKDAPKPEGSDDGK